jgi:hypothetical protein
MQDAITPKLIPAFIAKEAAYIVSKESKKNRRELNTRCRVFGTFKPFTLSYTFLVIRVENDD